MANIQADGTAQGTVETNQIGTDADNRAWLTVSEAARLIEVTPFQVTRWANNHGLQTNGKTGRQRRITLASAREQARRWRPRGESRRPKPSSAESAIDVAPVEPTTDEPPSINPSPPDPHHEPTHDEPLVDGGMDALQMIDTARFTVRRNGQACVLRNTKEFWFFAALAEHPGSYIPVHELLEKVWDGQRRSSSAIKSVAHNLRKALKEAGLEGIHIDGKTNRHHFALIIEK